jgi:RNA polymerase sigma factor (sigma-70 family)
VRLLWVGNGPFPPQTGGMAVPKFEDVVVPHLAAARRLARWLMGNEQDADDVVQEASLRAFRYFQSFTGGNGRAWFLTIVRNICYGWRSSAEAPADSFDEEKHWREWIGCTPEALVVHADTVTMVEQALDTLPHRARELLVRRELDELSYRELSIAMRLPMGTVMSGLSRARQALRAAFHDEMQRRSLRTPRRSPVRNADAVLVNRRPVGCRGR